MACLVSRNEQGQAVEVKLQDGTISTLFDKILKNVQISNKNVLDIYNNIYSKSFIKKFGKWEWDTKNSTRVYRAGELRRVDGKFGNAMYFAGNFNHSLQFGSPESYYISNDRIEDYGDRMSYLKAIADFHDIKTVPTKEQTNEFLESKFKEGKVVAVELIKGRKEYLMPSTDYLNNGVNHSITYKNGEPKLFYFTPSGLITESYREALVDTSEGDIKLGFITTDDILNTESNNLFEVANNDLVFYNGQYRLNNTKAFLEVASISSNSNPNYLSGFKNYLIRKGLLSDEQIVVDGNIYHKGWGGSKSMQIFAAQAVYQEALLHLGKENIAVSSQGLITLKDNHFGEVSLTSNNGEEVYIAKEKVYEDLRNGKYEDYNKKYQRFHLVATSLFKEYSKEDESVETIEDKKSDKELKLALLNVLSKLGVSVTSITDYIEKYNAVNGVDPSVEALADITNNVVAFAEGKNTVDNLSEETAHFIVESFKDQSLIEEILPQVENTKEWSIYSKQYYEIYSSTYKGEKLDEVVRREVLGKILKNKIQDNFRTEVDNVNFLSALKTMWNNFLSRVRALFTSQLKNNLNDVVEDIANKVVSEEINDYLDRDNLREGIYFSVGVNKILVSLRKSTSVLEGQLRSEMSSKNPNTSKTKKLIQDIKSNDEIYAINVLTGYAEGILTKYEKQLNNMLKTKKGALSSMGMLHVRNLYNDYLPILVDIETAIRKENLFGEKGVKVADTITELNSRILKLEGVKDLVEEYQREAVLEKHFVMNNITNEETKKQLRDKYQSDSSRETWWRRYFGLMQNSSNIYLRMLHNIFDKNESLKNKRLQSITTPFLTFLRDNNITQKDYDELIQRDAKGNPTGHIDHHINQALYEEELLKAQFNAFNEIRRMAFENAPEGAEFIEMDFETYVKNLTANKLKKISDFTVEEQKIFKERMAEWRLENDEKPMTPEFYERRAYINDLLGISNDVIEFTSELNKRRFQIQKKYKDNNKQSYSLEDLQELEQISRDRLSYTSDIDVTTGLKKEGKALEMALQLQKMRDFNRLAQSENIQEEVTKFEEKYNVSLKDEIDLKNKKRNTSYSIDNLFVARKRVVKSEFLEKLKDIQQNQGNKAAYDFLMANGGVLFNENFWNNLGDSSFSDRLDYLYDNIEDDRIKNNITLLKDSLYAKKEILKQYQVANNPSEIDGSNMPNSVKKSIREIESTVRGLIREVNSELEEYGEETLTLDTEVTPNKAYSEALEDSGKDEISFILENVLEDDKYSIEKFRRELSGTYQGKSTLNFLENYFEQELENGEDLESLLDRVDENTLVVAYGKTKLLPYYKRFAPEGYATFYNQLQNGELDIVELYEYSQQENSTKDLKDIRSFININPDYSWTEEEYNNEELNPNYNQALNGAPQPKLSKYENKDFYSKWGVNREEYLKDPLNYKNPSGGKLWELREHLLELKKTALDEYNESYYSVYELPQFSKGSIQKWTHFFKNPKEAIENVIKDGLFNRIDELGYGEKLGDKDIKDFSSVQIIPKFGIRKLEEKSDVSLELGYSYMKLIEASLAYTTKVDSESEVRVLMGLLNEKKEVQGLNDIKSGMAVAKDYVDFYMYGIKRTRQFFLTLPNGKKLDLAKVAMTFARFVESLNMKYNVFVPLTSLTSGMLNLRIEAHTGEFFHRKSLDWASKELLKLTPEITQDIGQQKSKAKLNVIAEFLRVDNLTERLENEAYGRMVRATNNFGFKLHEWANYPIKYRIMLSILDDYRVVEDRVLTFNDFKKIASNEGKTNKEILSEWEKHREKSLYNYLEVEDGKVGFKEEFTNKFSKDEVDSIFYAAERKIAKVNSEVDGMIPATDQIAARRDFAMRFVTGHRGWFSLQIDKRFKPRSFNYSTGQFEEGNYKSLGALLNRVYQGMSEKNIKDFITVFKEEYHKLDEVQQTNIRRIMLDLGALISIVIGGIAVAGLADDEDNKDLWALQMASYIYFRTANEHASIQPPTGIFGVKEMVKSPIIAMNTLDNLLNTKDFSFEEVNRGYYKGHSRLYRKLAKLTPAKHFYSMANVETTSNFYRKMNNETLFTMAK